MWNVPVTAADAQVGDADVDILVFMLSGGFGNIDARYVILLVPYVLISVVLPRSDNFLFCHLRKLSSILFICYS